MSEEAKILLEAELVDQDGNPVKISDIPSEIIVVYFYPRAMTSGCTREGIRFNELIDEFRKCRAEVVGVSTDPPSKNKKFAEKYGFQFRLLSDEGGKLAEKLGILKKGTKQPSAKRTTYILKKNGELIAVLKNVRPAEKHADEALKIVKELQSC
ncbi:MAG: peroxiredoxin [Desulfurococcales archaeon]|nr:peroxiredoxin [Desulfurococcales archaeon]